MKIHQNDSTTRLRSSTSTTIELKPQRRKSILLPASCLILSGLLAGCVLSVYHQGSQTIVEEQGTQEVLTTSQTPINTTQAVEVEQSITAQPITTTEAEPIPTLYRLTAYCPCTKCCDNGNGITATGVKAIAGRTIAVDPNVIPYGSEVVIYGHTYIAEDCGGLVNGNEVDIFFDTHQEALDFGVQYAEVVIK